MCENDFYIFFSSDVDLLPLDLKFTSLATKLEVSTAIVFRENLMHGSETNGRTDW